MIKIQRNELLIRQGAWRCAILLCFCASAADPQQQSLVIEPMQRTGIVLFGDSLTQRGFGPGGWGAGITDAYCRKANPCSGLYTYSARTQASGSSHVNAG